MPDAELLRRLIHMVELTALDAPPCVKAHYVVAVLLPRVAKLIGEHEFAEQLTRFMLRGLQAYNGTCVMCGAKDAVRGDDVCSACQAEVDQIDAMMQGYDDGEDTAPESDS